MSYILHLSGANFTTATNIKRKIWMMIEIWVMSSICKTCIWVYSQCSMYNLNHTIMISSLQVCCRSCNSTTLIFIQLNPFMGSSRNFWGIKIIPFNDRILFNISSQSCILWPDKLQLVIFLSRNRKFLFHKFLLLKL